MQTEKYYEYWIIDSKAKRPLGGGTIKAENISEASSFAAQWANKTFPKVTETTIEVEEVDTPSPFAEWTAEPYAE